MDVLAALRAAPGAGPALDALAGEPAVHVVGGAVRDALLRQEPRELDFVVEGDARPVARRAAERLGGEVLVHERFGTVIVRAPGVTFDVASARTETYPAPGALPEVRAGATLREDLARRDFTVNAMAVRLADGARTAWPGAQEDLAARVLRVLHRASFRDDPTRLLRLARYGARLGFVPDPDTDALAEEAVAGGAGVVPAGHAPRPGGAGRLLRGGPTAGARAGAGPPRVPGRGARDRRRGRRVGRIRGRCARGGGGRRRAAVAAAARRGAPRPHAPRRP